MIVWRTRVVSTGTALDRKRGWDVFTVVYASLWSEWHKKANKGCPFKRLS